MVMLTLRFDLRNPALAGTSSSERIQAAVDMCQWADERGAVAVVISEHHTSDDGYLPSPLVFASAVAARTKSVIITLAALLAPFYEPLRLAEDLAVLDNLSGGRVTVVLGGGYVPAEFEMFDVPSSQRGQRTEDLVHTLRAAWTGEPFEHRGRTVRVTPTPDRPGGPPLVLGGSSPAAARRAARIGDGYLPTTDATWEVYRDATKELGKPDPGPAMMGPLVTTYVAEDPEAAWDELLPYFLHESNAYGAWMEAAGLEGPYRRMDGDELRSSGQYRVVAPEVLVEELRAMGDMAFAMLHPLVGGIPPKRAWEYLHLLERDVLPHVG